MKEGDIVLVPSLNEDGTSFEGMIRKVFRDGTVWVDGKDKDGKYVGYVLKHEEVQSLPKSQEEPGNC